MSAHRRSACQQFRVAAFVLAIAGVAPVSAQAQSTLWLAGPEAGHVDLQSVSSEFGNHSIGETSWLSGQFYIKLSNRDKFFAAPQRDPRAPEYFISRQVDDQTNPLIIYVYYLYRSKVANISTSVEEARQRFSNFAFHTTAELNFPRSPSVDNLANPLTVSDRGNRLRGWVRRVGAAPVAGRGPPRPFVIVCEMPCEKEAEALVRNPPGIVEDDRTANNPGTGPQGPRVTAGSPGVGASQRPEPRIVILEPTTGAPAFGYITVFAPECTQVLALLAGSTAVSLEGRPEGTVVPLSENLIQQKTTLCIGFSKAPAPTRAGSACVVRKVDEVLQHANNGVPIELYAPMIGNQGFLCPELPTIAVQFQVQDSSGHFSSLPFAIIRSITGNILISGQSLANERLQNVSCQEVQSRGIESLKFDRDGWYKPLKLSCNSYGTVLTIQLSANFFDAGNLAFRLVTSADVTETQCTAEFEVPSGQLMTTSSQGSPLVNDKMSSLKLQLSQERNGIYRLVGDGRSKVSLMRSEMVGTIKFANDKRCALDSSQSKVHDGDISQNFEVKRTVSKNGLVALALTTVSSRLSDVDHESLVNAYEDILKAADEAIVKLRDKQLLDRIYLIDRYGATRADKASFMDEAGETGGHLLPNGSSTAIVNRLLYAQTGGREPLVRTGIAPLSPGGVNNEVNRYIGETRGYRLDALDLFELYLGWSPADGQSLCTAVNDLRPPSPSRRILAIEFATGQMVQRDQKEYRTLDSSREYILTCNEQRSPTPNNVRVLRILLPRAADNRDRRNAASQAVAQIIDRLFSP